MMDLHHHHHHQHESCSESSSGSCDHPREELFVESSHHYEELPVSSPVAAAAAAAAATQAVVAGVVVHKDKALPSSSSSQQGKIRRSISCHRGGGCRRPRLPFVVLQGPPHAFDVAWTYRQGADYVALCLWIGKDWSWLQLRWTTTAFFFGTTAAIWMIVTCAYLPYRQRIYSEAYKGVILCCWLLGLYGWMLGDLWTLWFVPRSDKNALMYSEFGNAIARYVLLAAVILYTLFYAILVPLDVFAADRDLAVVQMMERKSPPLPACGRRYFKEFRMYSSLHFYTWVVKDCLWSWGFPLAYFFTFCVTVALNLDLLMRFAHHSGDGASGNNLYIDFVNYFVSLLWVAANGLWAFGELVANAAATEDQFRRYTWPHWQNIRHTTFQYRFAAGWVFLAAASILVVFYSHWIVRSWQGKLPSLAEEEADFENKEQEYQQQQDTAPESINSIGIIAENAVSPRSVVPFMEPAASAEFV